MATDPATCSDDELAALCRRGQESAFRELYERYRQRIINFAYRMLRDRDMAADVLQETFQYFFRKIPEYRPEGKMSILLFRAARNLCLNRLKKSRRARELPLEENALSSAPSEDVSAPLEKEEVQSRIGSALEKLPTIYAEVIVLRILKDMPVSEVAQVLEVPQGTVKSRLHNGLELMRKSLRKRDFQ